MTTSQILTELDLRYRELAILRKKNEVLNISIDEIDCSRILTGKIETKRKRIQSLINALPVVSYVVLYSE